MGHQGWSLQQQQPEGVNISFFRVCLLLLRSDLPSRLSRYHLRYGGYTCFVSPPPREARPNPAIAF
jgi:hypothetical protein